MNKLSFPKGTLKFKRLNDQPKEIEKTEDWKFQIKEYMKRKKFVNIIEKAYPGQLPEDAPPRLPEELLTSLGKTEIRMRDMRNKFKNIPSFVTASDYEITFRHPKWSRFLGEIKVQSKRANIKDSLKLIADEFRKRKMNHRQIRQKEKIYKVESLKAELRYFVSGGCIYMPNVKEGVYAKFLKDQEKRIVFSPKIPKDKNNYIGVELEFMCDWNQDKLGLALFEAGVGKQVTLTVDGSLRCCNDRKPEDCPDHKNKYLHELCVLTKENEYKDIMKKVCDLLSKAGATVNKSCGMHVHLDMRNRDAEKAYQNLLSAQGILFKMNPKSRIEKYAKKVIERNFEVMKNKPDHGEYRYLGINPIAMHRHQTIETRIHSGTIDYTKITNWIAILVKIANHKERIIKNFVSLKLFCEEFNIDAKLKAYMLERIEKFKTKKDGVVQVEPEAERGVA